MSSLTPDLNQTESGVKTDRPALEEGVGGVRRRAPTRQDRFDLGVDRFVQNHALSAVVIVVQHQDDAAVEHSVLDLRGRDEESAGGVCRVHPSILPRHSRGRSPSRSRRGRIGRRPPPEPGPPAR